MKRTLFAVLALTGIIASCNNADKKEEHKETAMKPMIKSAAVDYSAGGVNMKAVVAYDAAVTGKRPAVLIVHEWWGLNDYVKTRANQLASMGYVAMAVDMYGNGMEAADPGEAGKLAMPFYKDPQMIRSRFEAALAALKKMPEVDTTKIAAIGYCFGGYIVLNAAKMGEPLVGVVSFHGGLGGIAPDKATLKAKVLVCHGGADNFESPEEIDTFKKQMDSVGADYSFKVYEGATHAFTNPASTANGKKFNMPIAYNAAADSASWNDMKQFFGKIFK